MSKEHEIRAVEMDGLWNAFVDGSPIAACKTFDRAIQYCKDYVKNKFRGERWKHVAPPMRVVRHGNDRPPELHYAVLESTYKNCRFRSRLECRWAIYFDAIGIEWEYEREAFKLPQPLGNYLPDFWLPQVAMWAEVKPGPFSRIEESKCSALRAITGMDCLMLEGPPAARSYFAARSESGIDIDYRITTEYIDAHDEHRFYSCTGASRGDTQSCFDNWFPNSAVDIAIEVAMGARFENGIYNP